MLNQTLLLAHICSAVVGLLSGFLAVVLRKGSGLHRAAGTVTREARHRTGGAVANPAVRRADGVRTARTAIRAPWGGGEPGHAEG